MTGNLATTNLLLGIMAVVSVFEALLVVAIAIAGWMLYQRATHLVETVEVRHVAPLAAHVHAILDDVQVVTTTIKEETERMQRIIGIARGLQRVVRGFLHAA